ncbi:hypothetical protein ACI3KS_05210 [Microbacterium sp. ZW T5_45]|uniref:hypothetical protein n=1 Tax=Microbacterium sp. ZW T5_45 TaxID=3378080 RepID=UPI0038530E7A
MRILTVRQPWAWAIIHGGKDVENRVRNIAGDYRGPVLIHAAQQVDLAAFSGQSAPLTAAATAFNASNTDVLKSGPWHSHRGEIIGVVDLVDVHHGPEHGGGCHKLNSPLPVTPTYDLCSPWGEAGAHHMVLADPRALDQPIPYRGALGLRKTEFDVIGDYLAAPWGHPKGQTCTPMGCEPGCHLEPVGRLVATS